MAVSPLPYIENTKLERAGAKSTGHFDVGDIAEVKRRAKRYGWVVNQAAA